MASETDICNLSLGLIDNDTIISSIDPPDATVEANWSKIFYPIARDALLEMHSWGFNTRRASLAQLASNPVQSWAFAYGIPNDCIRPLGVYLPSSTDDQDTKPFVVESLSNGTKVLFTNVESATLRFLAIEKDTTKFSPLFVTLLARLLASFLCGPLTKDSKKTETQRKLFFQEYVDATGKDASGEQHDKQTTFTPAHLKARM